MTNLTSIIPEPTFIQKNDGSFELTHDMVVYAVGAAQDPARMWIEAIAPAFGARLPLVSSAEVKAQVRFVLDPSGSTYGLEGYHLAVTHEGIEVRASAPAGLFYGGQTLRQLLPPEVFSPIYVKGVSWSVPCVEIQDRPRFGWRGAMLDVCRHFMPLEFVYRFIDLLALHKLNTFHWHLTEDQGWRIEIKRYPRLTEVGAFRAETLVGPLVEDGSKKQYDGVPHGGFYTQEQIREVVEYARQRYINVVPEIEMPGHAQAAIAAYPELGNTGEPIGVGTTWGVCENVYNAEESTLQFLKNVLDEVLELFPSTYVHVGGDECPKKQWKESPAAQARMKALGLKDEDELQSYFIRQMDTYLAEKGRRLVGWDEILEGGLAPGAVVMSWRGEEGGIAAANSGHDVIMSPCQFTYLDYYQSEDRASQPLAIGATLPIERVYHYDPISTQISADLTHHVLGTQAQLWTEYVPTTTHAEYMLFPRLCAFSEVAWTPAEKKNFSAFEEKLANHLSRFDQMGVNYCRKA